MATEAIRIGIGGPVGSGKTRLLERLLPMFQSSGIDTAVITNDLMTDEDAQRVRRSGLIDPDRVLAIETGACPHTAIREDPSANLTAVAQLESAFPRLQVVLIESGGDNLAATFTSDLVDYWIFVIDTAAGDDIPRKKGIGMLQADLLVINKIDLAPLVGADLDRMRSDVELARPGRASVFTDLRSGAGLDEVFDSVIRGAMVGDSALPAAAPDDMASAP